MVGLAVDRQAEGPEAFGRRRFFRVGADASLAKGFLYFFAG